MKAVHLVAAVLVLSSIALALAGETKLALGLFVLSTLVELVGAMVAGKSKNL